ncbi:hypothetical protein MDA_GLEAN10023581 [Myotis davidii]|uniref:Uncharacterized protein n=1 Tax=Myotis davidii TaxID=225400 RepID=L5M079_MYODS|nr:hypothetical protein MDA_GLEAN10023581 [Myotis davidii]
MGEAEPDAQVSCSGLLSLDGTTRAGSPRARGERRGTATITLSISPSFRAPFLQSSDALRVKTRPASQPHRRRPKERRDSDRRLGTP